MVRRRVHSWRIYGSWRPFTCVANIWSSGYAGMTLSETQKLSTGPTFPLFGMSSPRDETHCLAMWWDSMTTRQPTAHYHRSQQQELATALVLVGGDSQDARAIHGSSRSAMVNPSAFVLNGLRLVVVATPGWPNGPLLSTRSDNDDDGLCRVVLCLANALGQRCSFLNSTSTHESVLAPQLGFNLRS